MMRECVRITVRVWARQSWQQSSAAVDCSVHHRSLSLCSACLPADAVTHLTDAQEWAGNGSMVGAIKGEGPG
jgi:hypothetical protein